MRKRQLRARIQHLEGRIDALESLLRGPIPTPGSEAISPHVVVERDNTTGETRTYVPDMVERDIRAYMAAKVPA